MASDKQLNGISLKRVLVKRRLDQALNAKEFAVAAGISYSSAREWFRLHGFPTINGVVFWADFIEWRRAQTRVRESQATPPQAMKPNASLAVSAAAMKFPARASRVLLEAG